MATHSRHIRSHLRSGRVQIRFERLDLLWDGLAVNGRTGEVIACPMPRKIRDIETKRVIGEDTRYGVGPTILDMLTRRVVTWDDVPAALRPHGVNLKDHVVIWQVRDTTTLWPLPGQPQSVRVPREAEDGDLEPEEPDHPFLTSLASGGLIVDDLLYDGYVTVLKPSTATVSEGSYRLAIGMHGSIDRAYRAIQAQADTLWRQDIARAHEIWTRVQQAPLRILIEDREVQELRPLSSVSQELERLIMREACAYLGVDPDLDVSRGRGRPSKPENEADILKMEIVDGQVVGQVIRAFHGLAVGTVLSGLTTAALVELLGALRTEGHDTDAEYLEAYLDAAAPDWREEAAETAFDSQGSSAAEDPYDVLGVTRKSSDEDISAAFRTLMQAVQHAPNAAPQRRFTTAYKAIKAERKAAAAQGTPS